MNYKEWKQSNMDNLRNYIYCESNLIYEMFDEDIAYLMKKANDPFKSMNETIHEYDVLEAALDKDEFNIQLSRITKLTEDRYDFFTDLKDGPFDLETDVSETIELIIKAQLKIIYYCEELLQE